MSADGIWRIEQHSTDAWEPVGIALFEGGRYLRGGVDAYTVGTYELDGSTITLTAKTVRLGRGQPVYGTSTGEVEITLTGTIEGDEITGKATDGSFVTHYRYTRLADMPASPSAS